MRKRVLYEVGALLLLCLALSGCSGAELLEQVPRDLALRSLPSLPYPLCLPSDPPQ